MSLAFSSDGVQIIEKHLIVDVDNNKTNDLNSFYELNRCVQWIASNSYVKVALQFPDELLCDSATVCKALADKTEAEIYILADTTFGSCCVDEIAAQHVGASAVIHYGHACLSPTMRLPILYVFGKNNINICQLEDAFQQCLSDTPSHLVIFYDVVYYNSIKEHLSNSWQQIENVTLSDLHIPNCDSDKLASCKPGSSLIHLGRTLNLPNGLSIDQCAMFYIGQEGAALSNLMMTYNKCVLYSFNPLTGVYRKETMAVNRRLMQRYYMVEKLRSANVVGILIGTLGVSHYTNFIERAKILLQNAGKKYYTIAVGKPNPAKLANFLEIDAYVLIACPENTLLDSSDYYQSVVTPFELEVALNEAQQWTGEYETDFQKLLNKEIKVSSEPQYDVSLISGTIHKLGVETNASSQEPDNLTVSKQSSMTVALADSIGVSSSQRLWHGLDPQLGTTPVTKAVEGTKGTSLKYSHEYS